MKKIANCLAAVLALLILLAPVASAQAPSEADLEQVIIDAVTYNTEADISGWALTGPEAELLFSRLRHEGKLPWYTQSFSYSYREDDMTVVKFMPANLEPETYDRARYEQLLAELIDECVFEGMTPVQIALAVHDHLIGRCVYDESLERNTGYDLLVNGTTVCAGYTNLYMDILNRLGVPCIRVTSEEMNHAWNLVQIDGSWYHVDVTWDDVSPDIRGYAKHEYFLCTDAEISDGEDPHYGWETDISCNNTRFTDAWWKNVKSPICYESSDTCYLIRKNELVYDLCRRDASTGNETILYTESDHFVHTGEKRYAYGHYGLTLQNGRLYFGVQDEILSILTDGTQLRQEYTYDTQTNRKYILGVSVEGTTACLTIADHEGNKETADIPLADIPPQTHSHSYLAEVTAPTCELPGYTQWVCQCGLHCQSDPIAPAGHSFTPLKTKHATFWTGGFVEEKCDICSFAQTRTLEQIDFASWFEENLGYIIIWTACGVASIAALTPIWKKT